MNKYITGNINGEPFEVTSSYVKEEKLDTHRGTFNRYVFRPSVTFYPVSNSKKMFGEFTLLGDDIYYTLEEAEQYAKDVLEELGFEE